jgi:hypothetical protein
MKTRFRYRYDRLQERLIERLNKTDVKLRIRADRSIEFAKKWLADVDAEVSEIRFDIFQEPVIRIWEEDMDISEVLHRLADKNIPFIIENHNGTDWIIHEEADVEAIFQIEHDLGLNRIE